MTWKKAKYVLLFTCFFTLMLVVGCSPKSDTAPHNDNKKKEETNGGKKDVIPEEDEEPIEVVLEAPEIPSNIASVISYPVGEFSGEFYDEQQEEIEAKLEELPSISDVKGEEVVQQYWSKLRSLVAEEYPDPASVVAEWKLAGFGDPDIEDPKLAFKENYNVEIILDASGSMAAYLGGETMMNLAKDSIRSFAASLPNDAKVGLRVYGHKGTGSQEDKAMSCDSSELFYEIQSYDEKKLNNALDQFEPSGWTPIAESLIRAQKDLQGLDGENNTNVIYLVSDGVETCDGDPVKAAQELANSSISPLINVIGFNVDSEGQQQLKAVAEAANGTYSTVTSVQQLQEEFQRSQEMASKWMEWKQGADTENINTVLNRETTIFDFKNKWAEKSSLEIRNLDEMIMYLYKTDKITTEQRKLMKNYRNSLYDVLNEYENTAYNDLMDLAQQSYKEMDKAIQEKYKASN
ncbi:MAG TPA: VWA domain-containing protein [Bacillaceae bacterium]|nr:VWA domain-containing protein [Paenibacillus bovis]HLU21209.1 VWA domain-containing protein [Bacillaceae bacterium]